MNCSNGLKKNILDDLFHRPYCYDFFQAVRILNQVHRLTSSHSDPVRFKTLLSLTMPASSLYSLQAPTGQSTVPVLTVTFIGLTGPSGILPARYTELLLERRFRYKDQTAHHFLDLFSHRLTLLFYRAWQKHHVFIDYEQREQQIFQKKILALIGLGVSSLQGRLTRYGVEDQRFAFYAGRFSRRYQSIESLTAILSEQFNIAISIQPFAGRWMLIPNNERSKLGLNQCTLGHYPVLGKRIWHCQDQFRIRIGPLSFQRFQDFLPTGRAYLTLIQVVKFCVGDLLIFELQLVLDAKQVPKSILGTKQQGARLGWTSWLNRLPSLNADEVILKVS